MSDSKRSSKGDLNESNMPLLDEKSGETPEKEQIELTEGEKEDAGTEKKKKKEKKPKEKKPKGPSCIDTMSAGLNMANRDENAINTEIDIGFEDVLAEPSATQGFDAIWRLSFIIFSNTKLWFYRLFAAIVAVPASIVWAIVFALVSVLYVWVFSPLLRLIEFGFYLFRRVWNGIINTFVQPVCSAFGHVFANVNVSQKRHIVQEA